MSLRIELWTDGSGTTSGPGGWAYILLAIDTVTGEIRSRLEDSGGMEEATNNRAEITAVLQGLARLTRRSEVHVFSDSEYVVNALAKGWLAGWAANGWQKSSKPKDMPDGPMVECPICFKTLPDALNDTDEAPVECVFHGDPVLMVPQTSRKNVVNRDLWLEMLAALRLHVVHMNHIKGHSGIELNEMCDEMAGAARRAIIEAKEQAHA